MNVQETFLAGPYNLFYAAAFVAAFGLALWRGTRAGISAPGIAAFLVLCAAAGVIGSHFLPFDLSAPGLGEKTVLGGLAAVCAAALAGRIIWRLDARHTDALAIALPVGFAIGRIGCFLAGCCAGAPTDLPWGVRYAGSAEAVHPTQLYEAICGLVLAAVAQFRMRRGHRDILIPVVVLPYLAMRFGLQFLREMNGEFGITHVMLVASGMLMWAAHRYVQRNHRRSAPKPWMPISIAAVALILAAARVLTPLEAATLTALAFAGLVLFVARSRRTALRTLPAFASFIALQQADTTGADYPRRMITLGGGATTGRYEESCGGAHRYAMGGASVAYTTIPSANLEWTIKARAFSGYDRALPDTVGAPENPSVDVAGLGASVQGRYKWVGATLGVIAGDLYFDGQRESIRPVLGASFGPPQFFAEIRHADFDPSPVPSPMIHLGVGSRITSQGTTLRGGISDGGVYGNALLVAREWEFEPHAAIGEQNIFVLGISVRKRFQLGPGGR